MPTANNKPIMHESSIKPKYIFIGGLTRETDPGSVHTGHKRTTTRNRCTIKTGFVRFIVENSSNFSHLCFKSCLVQSL